jgi:serine protease Do
MYKRIHPLPIVFFLLNAVLLSCEAQEKKIVEQPLVIPATGVFNFRTAAKRATPCVVHVKGVFPVMRAPDFPDVFRDFFGDDFWDRHFKPQYERKETIVGSASGVIISEDGYVVTNNHVVRNAKQLEVVLYNNKSYSAKLIGADPSTDLALLKFEGKGLQFIEFGNSDSAEVGDLVLAVGNPFNLSSTVTAGIISAKARNINILDEFAAIESYIQTDAAVNRGNSGGALVDINGRLIGINSAIATPTGSYAGYSFAIPVEMVKKVIGDLRKFGKVNRGVLGVVISDNDGDRAEKLGTAIATGVVVDSVAVNSAAAKAGIIMSDLIIAADGRTIKNASHLREILSRKKPGEKFNITLIRKGKERTLVAALQ